MYLYNDLKVKGLGLASAVRTAPAAYNRRHGLTQSLCLASAPRLWPRHASANWREGTQKRLASVVQRWHATSFKLKAGRSARPCPSWRAIADGARPPAATDRSLGDWPHGWQHSVSRTRNLHFRERTLHRAATRHVAQRLCALALSRWAARGCLVNRHPGRPSHHAVPASHAACVASPSAPPTPPPFKSVRPLSRMRRARRRLRRPCLGMPAVGADGQVVPQQWLCATTAPGVAPDDRRRLDLVIYGASPVGGALCCDATLVSLLTRTGQPQPGTVADDGATLRVAERRKRAAYPELSSGGPPRLLVLGSEIGGRWNQAAQQLVTDLARVRAQRAPAGTASRSHLRLGCSGAASCEQHGARKPVARAPAREPGVRPCARPRRSSGAEPTAAPAVAACRRACRL